jgi:hypothetical protein
MPVFLCPPTQPSFKLYTANLYTTNKCSGPDNTDALSHNIPSLQNRDEFEEVFDVF